MDILDFIFPKECLECKSNGKYICVKCLTKLPSVKQVCPVCQKPSIDGFTHPKCTKPQSLNGLIALWPYKGVVRKAISSLKYKFVKEISGELSLLILQRVKNRFLFERKKCILTTVPLFWIRKNIRGYNQVDGVAKVLAEQFNYIFYADLLIRKKLKDPQAKLSKKKRVENIRGVFKLNPEYKSITKEACITIVDDVYTTGSTLREAGKVLKRNGAKEVWGLVIAK